MQSTEYIDFRHYWLAVKRRWLPATFVFGFVIALTSLNVLLQKPVYEAKGKLLIKRTDNVTSAITVEKNSGEKQLSSVGNKSDPLSTEVELIRSTSIIRQTIATLRKELKPQEFLDRLRVQQVEGTDIVEISYESSDPQEAAIAVNQVMNLYLQSSVLANKNEAATDRKFIIKQLPKTQANVHQAELVLRRFEEQNNVVDLSEESKSAVEVIANLENQVSVAQAKLADAASQSEVLQNKLGMNSQAAIAASSLSQSPGVQRALEEFQKVESELAIAQARFQELHPTVVELKSRRSFLESLLKGRVKNVLGGQQQNINENSQVEQLKQQITANLVNLEASRLGYASQVSAISNTLSTYKQRINTLPRLKQRKGELEREVEAAQATYETLLKRLEEIRVEENRAVGNARLVEDAQIPEDPIASNTVSNLALGSLLGMLLAVSTALILDGLDTSVKTVKEAREVFGYTLLGLIPVFGKSEKTNPRSGDTKQVASKILVRDIPRSPISEAYRMLQANLEFLSSDKELKVIVVTSSVPQEGKSTLCANLAVAIAQSERRVLIIDADMRQPSQHKIWNLLNQVGLSNVLVGKVETETAIKKVMDNLHVLSAGVTPPNPMAILKSQRMTSLIKMFSSSYDFVIIDTPSLNVAADAPILGKMVDGILLVVRPGVVDSASSAAAQEFLEQSGQNVLGMVINGVISKNKAHSYYSKEYCAEDSLSYKTVGFENRKNATYF